MIKGSRHQEHKTMLNICAPSNKSTKLMKVKTDRNERRDKLSPQIVKYIKTTLLRTDRISRQKVRKDLKEMNETGNKVDPTDTYRTLHAITAEYTLFSRTRGTFTVIKRILSHKIIHNYLKELTVIQSMFSEHNKIKLETNTEIEININKLGINYWKHF